MRNVLRLLFALVVVIRFQGSPILSENKFRSSQMCNSFSLAVLVLAVICNICVAEDAKDAKPDSPALKRDRELRGTRGPEIDSVTFFADQTAKEPLKSLVVLGWGNFEREVDGAGTLVLWVHNGRPMASASVFHWRGNLVHELACVSRGTVFARRDGKDVWGPKNSSVAFHDIPEAPAPAEGVANRLKQMKAIAEGFSATMLGWRADDGDRQELVLLKEPVYRYESNDKALVDGGVFAFVLGTDPEVLLFLEAVVVKDKPQWQYGLARSTSAALVARRDKEAVWSVGKLMAPSDPLKPNIALQKLLPVP
jgi:hypothetical protein